MKNLFYTLCAVAVGLIVGGLIGYSLHTQSIQVGAGSASGTTFSTAKVSQITGFAPSTASATTTSVYNGDGFDRIVTDSFSYCTGVGTSFSYLAGSGLANLIFTAATSSNATLYGVTNNNFLVNTPVATTTGGGTVYVASSTQPVAGAPSMIWPAGTYLVFRANATNTASCTVGVHYLGS